MRRRWSSTDILFILNQWSVKHDSLWILDNTVDDRHFLMIVTCFLGPVYTNTFSYHFHRTALRENDQKRWSFSLKTITFEKGLQRRMTWNAVILLSCQQIVFPIVFTENADFWKRFNINHNLFQLFWHTNNKFTLVFTVFNCFHRFSCRRLKTTWKRCVDAIQSLRFDWKRYRLRWTRIRVDGSKGLYDLPSLQSNCSALLNHHF